MLIFIKVWTVVTLVIAVASAILKVLNGEGICIGLGYLFGTICISILMFVVVIFTFLILTADKI